MVTQLVKNPPAMRETWVRYLGREDALGRENPLEMATHSSILAWRIPWTEEPGGLHSIGSQRVGQNWAAKHTTHAISLVICGMKTKTTIRYHYKPVGMATVKKTIPSVDKHREHWTLLCTVGGKFIHSEHTHIWQTTYIGTLRDKWENVHSSTVPDSLKSETIPVNSRKN